METITSEPTSKDEYLEAITSVWWDIDDCGVPEGCDGKSVAEKIKSALANLGYRGPVSISAYGSYIPESLQQSLQQAGISLNRAHPGVNVTKIKDLLGDLMSWVIDNPARANILLICGKTNRDFSDALNLLYTRGYNILLAQPSKTTSSPLFAAPKTVWLWTSILAGGSPFVSGGPGAEAHYLAAREAKYKAATTSVWWDIHYCSVPEYAYNKVSQNINSALLKLGYHGPVHIFAYGDTTYISLKRRHTLVSTGIFFTDVSFSSKPDKNDKCIKLLGDLMGWVIDNPAPANILLLSMDSDFSDALHGLATRGYNILLSCPLPGPPKTVWHWTSLLAGHSPIGSEYTRAEGILAKYKAANTSVWWDMDDCKVPEHFNVTLIAEKIRSALFNLGYEGDVFISAYGDTGDIPQSDQLALSGISLTHIPDGLISGPVIFDMFNWIDQNVAPANILLISGNEVYSPALKVFGERHYNVLLCASFPVAAKTVWHWTSLYSDGGSPIGCSGEITGEEYLAAKTSALRLCNDRLAGGSPMGSSGEVSSGYADVKVKKSRGQRRNDRLAGGSPRWR